MNSDAPTNPVPSSVRRLFRNQTPPGILTWILEDGTIVRERPDGTFFIFNAPYPSDSETP